MASTSEFTHWKNITNFEVLIRRCEEFGVKYNPSRAALTIDNMTLQYASVKALHEDYQQAVVAAILPQEERRMACKEMKKIAVLAVENFESSDVEENAKAKVRSLMEKITGSKVRRARLANGRLDPKHKSNSHLSYPQVIDNFFDLVEQLKSFENYVPNEDRLKIANMEALHAEAELKNSSVIMSEVILSNKMIARDYGLYEMKKGVIDIVLACKKYVRSVYGPKTEEAQTVTGIKFKRIKKLYPK
jgi:hypothetical protein